MKTPIAATALIALCLVSPFGQAQNLTNTSSPNMTSETEATVSTSATHFITQDTIKPNDESIRIVPAILAPSFAFMAIASYGINLARHSRHAWNDPVGVFAEAFASNGCFPATLTLVLAVGSLVSGSLLTYDLVKTMS